MEAPRLARPTKGNSMADDLKTKSALLKVTNAVLATYRLEKRAAKCLREGLISEEHYRNVVGRERADAERVAEETLWKNRAKELRRDIKADREARKGKLNAAERSS